MKTAQLFITLLLISNSLFSQSAPEHYKFSGPSFGNGDKALVDYFNERINLKSRDFKYQVKEPVVIKFKLSNDGNMSDFIIMDSSSSVQFNKEVFDYLKMSQSRWRPASINKQKTDINIVISVKLQVIDGGDLYYLISAGFVYLIDPVLINNYYNIGSELTTQKLYEDAIPYFDEVIKNSRKDIDALYNRGVCHLKIGNMKAACDDWSTIKNLGKPDADNLIQKYCNQ